MQYFYLSNASLIPNFKSVSGPITISCNTCISGNKMCLKCVSGRGSSYIVHIYTKFVLLHVDKEKHKIYLIVFVI